MIKLPSAALLGHGAVKILKAGTLRSLESVVSEKALVCLLLLINADGTYWLWMIIINDAASFRDGE
jgi:hypothetical protein